MLSSIKRVIAASAAAMFILSLTACNKEETPDSSINSGSDTVTVSKDIAAITNGAILHTWCWSFKTITESMADIADAGYTAIQTSPINECVVGGDGGMQLNGEGKWYYHYQPTDWTIGNYQLGTRDEFKEMCGKAHEYGLKVIVDVVPNHTTSSIDEVSQNLIAAAGGIDNLYHENGLTEIEDYNDRLQCTTGQMGGLPGVNTENKAFQDYFIAYLNDCIACGADGFRYDTAKHIGLPDDPTDPKAESNNFWERVTTEITNADNIFNYGEVLQDGSERIEDYQKAIGATTASAYGKAVREAVKTGNLTAGDLTSLMINVDNPTAVTWVESHDNYCNDGSYAELTNKQAILAWAIVCSRASGTPLFFDRPYESSVSNMWGSMNRIGAAGDPFYKDKTVAAVNYFRNAMAGESEKFINPPDANYVLITERGSKGAVIVNAGKYSYNLNMQVDLADGTYVNRADGKTEYTVSGGILTGTILSGAVAVLYNDGYKAVPEKPEISAEAKSFIVSDSAVSVTLHCKNADEAVYSVDGGAAAEYNDGDKIEVGENAEAGTSITVKLTAKNSNGETTMTYYFTVQGSRSVEAGTKIFFKKPDNWKDKIYAYVYDESTGTVRQAAPWPGVECVSEGDSLYSYTFDEDWSNVLVIFTDGSSQFPKAMEPGMVVVPDMIYSAG